MDNIENIIYQRLSNKLNEINIEESKRKIQKILFILKKKISYQSAISYNKSGDQKKKGS